MGNKFNEFEVSMYYSMRHAMKTYIIFMFLQCSLKWLNLPRKYNRPIKPSRAVSL